ncbi:MAG: RES family NAD+ phosphorylase [Ktedonobacterales bacterium]
MSKDLDQFQAILYSGVEPQRQRYHRELVETLSEAMSGPMDFHGWVRMVAYRYGNEPLAATGSLLDYGGRFNIGRDVDNSIPQPWPALYIASDQETAYRERYGLTKTDNVGGLSADDLSLGTADSHTVVRLSGHLEQVLDLSRPEPLEPFCKVLSKIRVPSEGVKLQKRLRIPTRPSIMIRTAPGLLEVALHRNWRTMPVQFGIPSVSQILASLALDAGCEAIRYPSSKGGGDCLAVFPHCLVSDTSCVTLDDLPPEGVRHRRLDLNTADDLCGWEVLPHRLRPRRP